MFHILQQTRVRLVILLIFVIVTWQIFRRWPDQLEVHTVDKSNRVAGTPVVVMVFYEALCPDSKNFIIKQLQTTFYKAPTLINLQLVPYGKATTSVNQDGSLRFECQHGTVECNANMYHACVIEAIDEPKVLLDVITCMIRDNNKPKEAMQKCSKENQIDAEQIQKCFDSPHGAELLKLHGEVTHALRPTITFIPTITLDGSQGRQASILKDLFAEVCKAAGGSALHPDVCT